jgi:uncharacterized protein YwqG
MKNRILAAIIITIAVTMLIIQNPPWEKSPMSLFDNFFGRNREGNSIQKESIDEHLEYLASLRKPAILMAENKEKQFSKIGGLPDVPEGFVWPLWKDKPLSFLCQIDLSQIPVDYTDNDMPRIGFLYFFYDQEQGTWGFDPKDKGSWYLYYTETIQTIRKAEKPNGLEIVYKEKYIKLSTIHTYPDYQDERIQQKLNDKQVNTLLIWLSFCNTKQ